MTWCLVGNTGVLHMLEPSMMFVGRENCEITVQSRSVDKRHSVVNYDQIDDIFSIKDMGSLNGTFVNETRIPEQTYITLQQGDAVRFGYDPVTYRFDQVDPSQIRQVKDAQGITRLEAYNVEENGNKPAPPKAFLDRTGGNRQYLSTEQGAGTDNSRHTHNKQKPAMSEMIRSPRGSPLYGQPEWWGEPDNVDNGFRLRTGTYDATDKEQRITQEKSQKERPTKLPLGDTTRDIPVHIYTSKRTDIKPTSPNKQVKTPEDTEVTVVKASDRHVGFTIEFNAKEDSPKMCKKESLQDFVPVNVKNKINENKRIVEGLKAERLSKKGENPDSLQSPTTSPPPGKKSGRRRSGSNETAASRTKANKSTPSTSKSSKRRQSDETRTMDEDGDGGDNVSETGTYTIESESQDVVEARQRIDEVFGVNGSAEDGQRGSEEDTDKDISDEEIEEEAITRDVMSLQHAGFSRKEHLSSPEAEPYADGYVAEWARDAGVVQAEEIVEDSSGTTPSNSTVIKNDQSPPEREPSSPGRGPSNHRQAAENIGNSSSRKSSKGRRMLPTTPAERQEQSDSPRQNGLHPSQGSAFHSPRDGEQPVRDNHVSSRNGGLSYTPRRAPMAPGVQQPRPPMEPRNSWEQEGSVDTEILLKDTETFMKSLEKKMKGKRESPSPEPDMSEALSHRDFDADVDTDLESASHVSVVGKGLYNKRGSSGSIKGRTALPTKQEQKSDKSNSKDKTGKSDSEQPRKSTIWSRLSTPNKHKRSSTTSDKESSLMSDNQSDSEGVGFRRNTSLTASLPIGRTGGRKTPSKDMSSSNKKETKKDTKKKEKAKPKTDLSKPRQTRSTMLRKSRFGEKDSAQDQSDISPTSSISDLSSSKPAPFKRYGSSRDTNKSKTSRSKPVQSKVDYSRARPSASSTTRGSGTDSLGSQIARHARSQSVREGRSHSGETSSRVMSKIGSSNKSSSSRRSSISSTDGTPASNVRKTSSSGWRRYQGDSDNDAVDAYIQTVTSRRTTSASSYDDNKAKSSSMHNLTNHKQGQQQASVQAAGKLGDEIAHVSSSLAQSLQRLTKMTQGDTGAEAALESLPKEEKVMDELFSEDTVFLPKSQSQTCANVAPPGEEDNRGSRLQRASSLSLYPDDNFAQALPNKVSGGSPPVALKHKHWGKTNESFDNLVLSSVNHLSLKLKDSSDRIAYKLKYLQYPNASEDELAEAVKESEFALLKTGNAEIASILRNMRQMEKRLADIHAMIDPRNEIQLPRELSPAAQIRRKYIGEYGNVSTASGNATSVALKSPSTTSPRHNWQKKSPTSGGGRSVFSDGEDVEVYL